MTSLKQNGFIRFVLSIIAATAVCIWYQGCGGYANNSEPIGTFGLPTFVGPGSVWNVYINTLGGVIELVKSPGVGVGRDYVSISQAQTYSTGFTTMSVFSVGPGTNGAPVGSTSYALQIPGFAFFMAPFGTPGSILGMVPPACPVADVTANWIKLRQPSSWSNGLSNGDAFGTMTFAASGASALVTDFNLDSVTNSDSSTDMGPRGLSAAAGCGNGTFTDGAYESFTSSAGLFVHSLADDSVYFALPSGSTPTAASLVGNFAGILYQTGSSTNSPVSLTLATSGGNVTGTATILSDVTTGTGASGTNPTITLGSVSLSNGAASGFIAGSINFGSGNDPLVCLPQTAAGGSTQILLVCSGEDDAAHFLSLVLVSH